VAGHGEKIEARQERAISALLQAQTMREAAKEAGISESTLLRWLHDETFMESYRKAKRQVVQLAICQLQRSAGKAAKVLLEVAEDKVNPASARVSAAKTILETSLKAVEIEDLEKRISHLEEALKTKIGGKGL